MKIKYTFVTGETTEVEVNEEVGTLIMDSRRIEENADRKERYHCYSLDTEWETEKIATKGTPETEFITRQDNSRLYEAFSQLSDLQKERMLKLANGMSAREIARQEGKDHKTILESIEAARKKIKKFL